MRLPVGVAKVPLCHHSITTSLHDFYATLLTFPRPNCHTSQRRAGLSCDQVTRGAVVNSTLRGYLQLVYLAAACRRSQTAAPGKAATMTRRLCPGYACADARRHGYTR